MSPKVVGQEYEVIDSLELLNQSKKHQRLIRSPASTYFFTIKTKDEISTYLFNKTQEIGGIESEVNLSQKYSRYKLCVLNMSLAKNAKDDSESFCFEELIRNYLTSYVVEFLAVEFNTFDIKKEDFYSEINSCQSDTTKLEACLAKVRQSYALREVYKKMPISGLGVELEAHLINLLNSSCIWEKFESCSQPLRKITELVFYLGDIFKINQISTLPNQNLFQSLCVNLSFYECIRETYMTGLILNSENLLKSYLSQFYQIYNYLNTGLSFDRMSRLFIDCLKSQESYLERKSVDYLQSLSRSQYNCLLTATKTSFFTIAGQFVEELVIESSDELISAELALAQLVEQSSYLQSIKNSKNLVDLEDFLRGEDCFFSTLSNDFYRTFF